MMASEDETTREVPIVEVTIKGESRHFDLDDLITMLGLGPWTCLYLSVASLYGFSQVMNVMGSVFMAPPVPFTCTDVDGQTVLPVNGTECWVQLVNNSNGSRETVPCKNFSYSHETFETTVTEDYDLVCSRTPLHVMFQMSISIGCCGGAIIGLIIGDRYGRQTVVWYSAVCSAICAAVLVAKVSDYNVVLIARFFIGVFTITLNLPSIALAIEMCPMKYRAMYGVLSGLTFLAGMFTMTAVSYTTRNWRIMQFTASMGTFITVLVANPLVSLESPRWLVTKGRLKDAEKTLRHIARYNNKTNSLPDDLHLHLSAVYRHQQECRKSTEPLSSWQHLKSLYASKYMRKITVINYLMWYNKSLLYLAIPLNANHFSSVFVYMSLLAVSEIPAYTITGAITTKFGRKRVISIYLMVVVVMQGSMVIMMGVHYENGWLNYAMSAVAYTFVASSSQVNVLYTTELFPTSVRTLAFSAAVIIYTIGLVTPSGFTMLVPISMPWVPTLFYCFIAALAGSLVLLLPETNGQPLHQTVDEYVQFAQEKENNSENTFLIR
uniref:Organic cation transporter protein-like n=1 Tax=Hirondellea gigas TaxID=1518452 RepID=A0A6A7FNQ3_9CRUS